MSLGQHLTRHRQHRGIPEMEKDDRSKKNQEILSPQQFEPWQRLLFLWLVQSGRRFPLFAATRHLVIYFPRIDNANNEGTSHGKETNKVKDPMIAKPLAHCAG